MSLKRLRHCSHSDTATSPFTQTAQMNHRRELCSGILFLAREQAVLKLLPIMGVQRERTQNCRSEIGLQHHKARSLDFCDESLRQMRRIPHIMRGWYGIPRWPIRAIVTLFREMIISVAKASGFKCELCWKKEDGTEHPYYFDNREE